MRKRTPLIMLLAVTVFFTALTFPNKVKAADNTKPRVIITKYEIENGGINSAEPAKVTITLKNMSTSHAVNSVLLTCVSNNNYFCAEYGTSNQAYVDQIGPSQEKQVEISLTVKEGIDVGSLAGNINISYADDANQTYSSDSQIVIPVKGNELNLSKIYVPNSVAVNEKSGISVSCENLADKQIYDVMITIKADNSEETSAKIGSLLIGSRKSKEMYLTFDTIGNHQITVQLSYKDAAGIRYQMAPHEYQINVVERNDQINSNINGSKNTVNYISVIKKAGYAAAILICIILAVVWINRNRKN